MKKSLLAPLLATGRLTQACEPTATPETPTLTAPKAASTPGHAAWVRQGDIYKANVRRYTPEGTLNAFGNYLF